MQGCYGISDELLETDHALSAAWRSTAASPPEEHWIAHERGLMLRPAGRCSLSSNVLLIRDRAPPLPKRFAVLLRQGLAMYTTLCCLPPLHIPFMLCNTTVCLPHLLVVMAPSSTGMGPLPLPFKESPLVGRPVRRFRYWPRMWCHANGSALNVLRDVDRSL